MRTPYVSTKAPLNRRGFLRGLGVVMALPMLDAMCPVFQRPMRAAESGVRPNRFLGICNNLGVLPDRFFPSAAGAGYELSPYLSELSELREQFSVLSGVSHPGVDGSHSSDVSFLTAAPHPASGGFRNSISLDQFIASKVGHLTRFPSLTLGVNAKAGRRSLSWTDSGVLIPCENRASQVYRKLFLQGSKEEVDRQLRQLRLGQSIMDAVAGESRALYKRLGAGDRERLDQYMTAVREVEKRMVKAREWENEPKPAAPIEMPKDPAESSAYMEKTRLMYQMARLAFQTDSTRSVTLLLDSNNSPAIHVPGATISDGYHNLSHHGKSPEKLAQLEAIDRAHMGLLRELLKDLENVTEAGGRLLDRTAVMYGSNFGDANKHTTDNLPILVAGGRLRHGRHLAFDQERNYPLPNLFVTLLQSMEIEVDRFASSTGTLRGLEIV